MRDYPKKFSAGLGEKKNLPLYEEGGEVDRYFTDRAAYEAQTSDKQNYTLEFPDRPTSFGDSSKEEATDSEKE